MENNSENSSSHSAECVVLCMDQVVEAVKHHTRELVKEGHRQLLKSTDERILVVLFGGAAGIDVELGYSECLFDQLAFLSKSFQRRHTLKHPSSTGFVDFSSDCSQMLGTYSWGGQIIKKNKIQKVPKTSKQFLKVPKK